MAINSKNGRSQNQLHIHISCVLPSVSEKLETTPIPLYPAPAVKLQLGAHNNTYMAVKVTGLAGQNSPFEVIQAMPGAKDHMADQSIAVIGSGKPNEYYVVNTTSNGANPGYAEELLDETCQSPSGGR